MFCILQTLEGKAGALSRRYADMVPQIRDKVKEFQENWERLEDLAQARYASFIYRSWSCFSYQVISECAKSSLWNGFPAWQLSLLVHVVVLLDLFL